MRKLRFFLLFSFLVTSSTLFGSESVNWILSLGGTIERDPAANVLAVSLRGSWVNDVELISLARLPHLERLDLSHTRITDEGLLLLKTAPKINV